ncbi:MAG: ATP synthase F0 subunit B [Thermodesulfovibrionales bacterium]|nr:ATP synthase F0 subunit B [Thermodesulfovibrionales bacterium]
MLERRGKLEVSKDYRHFWIMLVLFFILALSGISQAAGEAEHHAGFWDWFWRIVNFAILVAILVIFAGKPLRNFLKKRSETIERALNEARQARELAEKALREVEERFSQKDIEIERVLSTAKKAGEIERDSIIEEGKRISQRLIEDARKGIELEKKKAIEKLKEEAALLAIELAEKKLQGLTEEEKKRLLEDSIKRIEERSRG